MPICQPPFRENLSDRKLGPVGWAGAQRVRSVLGGKTQKALARELHVDQGTVSKWLNGHRSPDPDALARLCRALDVSADYVLGLSADPELRRAWVTADEVREEVEAGPALVVLQALVKARLVSTEQLRMAVRQLGSESGNIG